MNRLKTGGAAIIALVTALQAAPAQAQDKAAKASELEYQAQEYAADVDGFGKAASLYRKAANLRLEGDPQGIRDLIKAGRLWFYVGRADRAAADLAKAGRIAHEYGDVVTAARAYLDAAWAADASGNGARAFDLATKAQRLAQSPLLARQERVRLLARIDEGIGQQ
jgi:tetratricopeptide (TPR) repeat protein